MKGLVTAMGPVVFLWMVPLFPMIYLGIVGVVESLLGVLTGRKAST